MLNMMMMIYTTFQTEFVIQTLIIDLDIIQMLVMLWKIMELSLMLLFV